MERYIPPIFKLSDVRYNADIITSSILLDEDETELIEEDSNP